MRDCACLYTEDDLHAYCVEPVCHHRHRMQSVFLLFYLESKIIIQLSCNALETCRGTICSQDTLFLLLCWELLLSIDSN